MAKGKTASEADGGNWKLARPATVVKPCLIGVLLLVALHAFLPRP